MCLSLRLCLLLASLSAGGMALAAEKDAGPSDEEPSALIAAFVFFGVVGMGIPVIVIAMSMRAAKKKAP